MRGLQVRGCKCEASSVGLSVWGRKHGDTSAGLQVWGFKCAAASVELLHAGHWLMLWALGALPSACTWC